MTFYVLSDAGLMLQETANLNNMAGSDITCLYYSLQLVKPLRARVFQVMHIITRPISLIISDYFVMKFNTCFQAPSHILYDFFKLIKSEDIIIWLNPTYSLVSHVDELRSIGCKVNLYFLDPINRLGITEGQVCQWQYWLSIFNYSKNEAQRLGNTFLIPYAPSMALLNTYKDIDIVYIGSPSPRRLLWVIVLGVHLRLRNKIGILKLGVRSRLLVKLLPFIFSPRISFEEYSILCARSRGILEIHERDAGGVTLRATLCRQLNCVHLSNILATPNTILIKISNLKTFDQFLINNCDDAPNRFSPPEVHSLSFIDWVYCNFDPLSDSQRLR